MAEQSKPPESTKPWIKLCEQAAVEQDPEKLIRLVQAISTMLEENEQKAHANLCAGKADRLRKEA